MTDITQNKEAALAALNKKYLERLPGQVEEIRAGWEAVCAGSAERETLEQLYMLVHKLHGTSGTYGFKDISDLVRDFEAYLNGLVETGREPAQEEKDRFTTLIEQLALLAEQAGHDASAAVFKQEEQAPAEPSTSEEAVVAPPRSFRILIAEDSALLRRRIAVTLAGVGMEVEEAENGAEVLRLARTQRPDLILLDVMMPGMDGLETLRQLRADGALAGIPVVMLTARHTEDDVMQAQELGIADYIAKPVDPEVVLHRVAAVLTGVEVKEEEETEEREQARVLVVEDSGLMRKRIALSLSEAGFEVIEAEHGLEALSVIASEGPPDLVLLDVLMPEMDGMETLRRIRQDAALRALPVMMLTARSTLDDVKKAVALGIEDYVAKPIDPDDLIDRVRGCLAKRGFPIGQDQASSRHGTPA